MCDVHPEDARYSWVEPPETAALRDGWTLAAHRITTDHPRARGGPPSAPAPSLMSRRSRGSSRSWRQPADTAPADHASPITVIRVATSIAMITVLKTKAINEWATMARRMVRVRTDRSVTPKVVCTLVATYM